ncbi:hypothetical protein [Lonsdalea britannica]|nr:hypothetical protein [Lonsdalea britannica]
MAVTWHKPMPTIPQQLQEGMPQQSRTFSWLRAILGESHWWWAAWM